MTLGHILHLQRLSTEDGPGIRTTVFLKGCPLSCAWCHNPEAISPRLQIQWFAERCLGCRTCVETCPNKCLHMTDAGLIIDRDRCDGCAACGLACPSGALEALGRLLTAEELLQGLRAAGMHTALDTCGLCPPATLDRLLPHTDLVLFDLKLLDSKAHQQWTGAPNSRILDNLRLVADFRDGRSRPVDLWIRTPLIPGATVGDENLRAIGQYLAANLQRRVTRWELCAFNNLCRDQYRRLGQKWAFADTPLMPAEELRACQTVARASGLEAEIVATDAVRLTECAVE